MKYPAAHPLFLQGGGKVGALMREHDWSASPLGPPQKWPQALCTVVGLLLQSPFPMAVAWGEELGFLYNDPYAEIIGTKHPGALGQPFREIWAELWTDLSPLIDAAMAGHASYREDLPIVMNRKGYDEQTWFTFSYSPVRDDSGKVAGMFCAVSETTRRVLAKRELCELNETRKRRVNAALAERELLADIVEVTDAFVQVVDFEYRWLAINQAAANEFERLFGVRPQVGDDMLELLASQPANQAAVKALWSRALAGEEFVEIGEFEDPARNRRSYEIRFNTLRGRDGSRIGAYQFVYDVTKRQHDKQRLRRAQEALRQSQKMESLGQLTGGVAHDFNNLLAVFANGFQILERDVSAEQRQRVYASMRRAVERGSALTRQLLSFSRRRPINPESIDLAISLDGMRELLARSLRGDIELKMELTPGLWPVEIDPGEFELAMLNLCVNARDAMAEGGTIRITASNEAEVRDSGEVGEFVRLSVEDTGCGMPPDTLNRVFEPFFTTKDIGKGSGLGLPQVYGFVQQSEGRVTVDSKVDLGTVVTMLLPRSLRRPADALEAPNASAMPNASPRRGHVLLVEDDVEVAALTREMLSELGFTVIHAASAEAALAALANARTVDVVFSDIMMPGGISGLELAREIRRRHPHLPVVLTTGYSDVTAIMKSQEFKLLLKPYSIDDLCKALSTQADGIAHGAETASLSASLVLQP